ncbi:MAG: type II secretion system inner membrane protein GspF [Desulfatirhabdiaceae bacterium]
MPVFEYTALNAKGKTVSGIIDADSAVMARQKIRSGDLYPVTIQEAGEQRSGDRRIFLWGFQAINRVRAGDLTVMTRQLASLIGAGIPLVPAIEALIPHTRSKPLKKQLAQIKNALLEGKSLSSALSNHSETFTGLYIHLVHAGESSGTLEVILERLADILEKQQLMKTRIRTAMVYPIFMTVVGVAVLSFLVAVIVPGMAQIFKDMNQVLPVPTRMLIWASAWFRLWWWALLGGIAGFTGLFISLYRTGKGKLLVDQLMLQIPVIGSLIGKISTARIARTLGSLLQNGVSMLTALTIVGRIAGNSILSHAVDQASFQVEKGKGLAASLEMSGIFPSLALQMIQVGEQTGELETMLYRTADLFDRETESTLMRMISVLEPTMILVMGVIVGFIVLSVCLPVFEMNQLVM